MISHKHATILVRCGSLRRMDGTVYFVMAVSMFPDKELIQDMPNIFEASYIINILN